MLLRWHSPPSKEEFLHQLRSGPFRMLTDRLMSSVIIKMKRSKPNSESYQSVLFVRNQKIKIKSESDRLQIPSWCMWYYVFVVVVGICDLEKSWWYLFPSERAEIPVAKWLEAIRLSKHLGTEQRLFKERKFGCLSLKGVFIEVCGACIVRRGVGGAVGGIISLRWLLAPASRPGCHPVPQKKLADDPMMLAASGL